MGLRFRKSVKIAPGVRLNLNKNSTSVSFGGKGAHYTVSSNGRRTASVGIPGTGISYSASTSSGKGGKARDTAKSSGGSSSGRGDNDKNGCLWLLLGIALLPILLTYWLWTTDMFKLSKKARAGIIAVLLKAHMMNTQGERSIYYKDNPNRTLSLENCIEKVFTNRKAPLRLNLEKIIELRNTSTHFITEEYEMVYVPLFQSCVFNYTEKLHDFFGIEANKYVPQNFLTLTVSMRPLDVEEIRAKYPPELANRLLQASADIQSLSAEENNAAFAIRIEHYHYITKDKDKATSTIHIDKNAETSGVIIKEIQDPNNVYPFNEKRCITRINKRLASDGVAVTINSYHFRLFVQHYGIKSNPKLCYSYNVPSHPMYSYSMATIDLIVMEIEKDPENILQVLKERSKKEETPGAKDSKH